VGAFGSVMRASYANVQTRATENPLGDRRTFV